MINSVKFDDKGLVTAIAQDADNGEVLMLAYMNAESLRMTLDSGIMTYWSRSRSKLWIKGESSGHTQQVVEIRMDCDGDALLFQVRQEGGACHTGYRSCFYRKTDGTSLIEDGLKVFDPDVVYKA
jgi:phosphoribosyl-AMP cyclohydrolase